MTYTRWMIAILVLLCGAATPLLAQGHGGKAGRPVSGHIVAVDAGQRVLRLQLLTRVQNPDAPGTVPAEMARQAAAITEQAVALEKQGKAEEAKRLRRHIEELLRWREVVATVANADQVTVGIDRVSLDKVTVGSRIRIAAMTENAPADGEVPARVTLVKDAIEVDADSPAILRRLPYLGHKQRNTFFEITGEVTGVKPLMLKVDNQTLQIDTPAQYGCVQQTPIKLRDLQPNQRVLVRAKITDALQVTDIKRVMVVLYHPDNPIGPEEMRN